MMTVSEDSSPIKDLGMLDLFYQDTWETACIDAARDKLREYLSNNVPWDFALGEKDFFISSSFGPGYYGMDIADVSKFFELLDGDKIGIKLNQYGVMVPAKSNVGFFLVMKKEIKIPKDNCGDCLGNDKGCIFCKNTNAKSICSKVKY